MGGGGIAYLLNKVFLSCKERARRRGDVARARQWDIAAWTIYLVGLPPWVIVFLSWRNWIAGIVEASGGPAIVLGIVIAFRGSARKAPAWLTWFAFGAALVGIVVSIADFGGFTVLNQYLEIALVGGYLLGTLLLPHGYASGYVCFMVMHAACGWLMWVQGFPWLLAQQVISSVFVVDAFVTQLRTHRASA